MVPSTLELLYKPVSLAFNNAQTWNLLVHRWVVGTSYRVSFGHDPIANAGGGLLRSFESVPSNIYLNEDANMEVPVSYLFFSNLPVFPWLLVLLILYDGKLQCSSRCIQVSLHSSDTANSHCNRVNISRSL